MCLNKEIFNTPGRQKLTTAAFFSYVHRITNRDVLDIFLADERFVGSTIDTNKVFVSRLDLKYKRKKLFRNKYKCPVTGRYRARISFLGGLSRFQLKEMVVDGQYLVGISRHGW